MPVGSYIASTGDFNGDGTMDLLLVNSNGDQTIWYTGYYDGAPYKAGPAPPAQAGYTVQPRLSSGPPAPCSSPRQGERPDEGSASSVAGKRHSSIHAAAAASTRSARLARLMS